MGQRAELVGERLARLVLERVGVDRVEAEAQRLGALGEFAVVADLVPGEMRRAGRRRARELVDRRAILELVENVARLAGAGKAGEARAAGADAPGRDGDGEGGDLRRDRLDVEAAPRQLPAERAVIVLERGGALRVLLGDQRIGNAIGHGSLPFPLVIARSEAEASGAEGVYDLWIRFARNDGTGLTSFFRLTA